MRIRPDISTSDVVGRYLRGDSMREIAADLGCSFGLIRNILEREDVPRRPPGGPRGSRGHHIAPRSRPDAPPLADDELARLRRAVGLTT